MLQSNTIEASTAAHLPQSQRTTTFHKRTTSWSINDFPNPSPNVRRANRNHRANRTPTRVASILLEKAASLATVAMRVVATSLIPPRLTHPHRRRRKSVVTDANDSSAVRCSHQLGAIARPPYHFTTLNFTPTLATFVVIAMVLLPSFLLATASRTPPPWYLTSSNKLATSGGAYTAAMPVPGAISGADDERQLIRHLLLRKFGLEHLSSVIADHDSGDKRPNGSNQLRAAQPLPPHAWELYRGAVARSEPGVTIRHYIPHSIELASGDGAEQGMGLLKVVFDLSAAGSKRRGDENVEKARVRVRRSMSEVSALRVHLPSAVPSSAIHQNLSSSEVVVGDEWMEFALEPEPLLALQLSSSAENKMTLLLEFTHNSSSSVPKGWLKERPARDNIALVIFSKEPHLGGSGRPRQTTPHQSMLLPTYHEGGVGPVGRRRKRSAMVDSPPSSTSTSRVQDENTSASRRRGEKRRRRRQQQQQQRHSHQHRKHSRVGGARSTEASHLCRRTELYVDFAELNWQDWIVAPVGYQAYQCRGRCTHPMPSHLNTTNHAIIQSLLHSMDPRAMPAPQCVPVVMAPISILYRDVNDVVVVKTYPDMKVEACGCQ